RSSVTSSAGMLRTNQQNPAPSSTAPAAPAVMVKKPITRAKLPSMLKPRRAGLTQDFTCISRAHDLIQKPVPTFRDHGLIDHIEGPVHGMPRGHRSHHSYQHHLAEHGDIAGDADRKRSKQGR